MAPTAENKRSHEATATKSSDVQNNTAGNTGNSPFRPGIATYQTNKFQVDDKVWLTKPGSRVLEGPYWIAGMPAPGKYILSLENGNPAENGAAFNEEDLEFVD